MRRILWILAMLAITQEVYGMDDDDQVALKIQTIKVQQPLFDSKSLEEQQQMLISALNVCYEAKKSAQFPICLRLGRPLAAYEGFDQIENSFTPDTRLQFSGKMLPIKDISREDLTPLINYLLNKSAIFSFKRKLTRNPNFFFPHLVYEEDFKKNRHELLWEIYKAMSDYATIKEEYKTHAMAEISKYSIFKEVFKNHAIEERPLAFNERMLECRLLRKDYTTKKEEITQEILNKREEFQNTLNKERKIKNIVKNSNSLNLCCNTRSLIKAPSEFCNSNCVLTAFMDFSLKDLFNFYDIRFHKLYELKKINELYTNKYALFYLSLQSNAPYLPQKKSDIAQEKPSYNTQKKTYSPIVLLSPQSLSLSPTQERLRKKLQSQKEKTEEEKKNTAIRQEENYNKIKKTPIGTVSIEEISHNILEDVAPRDGYKKSCNQRKGKQGRDKKGGGQEEKPNLTKSDSRRQQLQKKGTTPKKQSITPSTIMINMKGGGIAAIGASRPSDGQEEDFKPQSVKKPPQEKYGSLKKTRKPTPKGEPQNKPQDKAQPTDSFPSSKPNVPGNASHPVVITPPTLPSKDQSYLQILQNLRRPEAEPLLDSREKIEEKGLPKREKNGDNKNQNLDEPTVPSEEERNSENSNKDLIASSEQSPSKIKQNLIATQEPEVQNDKTSVDQSATPLLELPLSPIIFPSNEYRIEDHPRIAKILIQHNIAHIYTHEREEAEFIITKYSAALATEKRAREASDQQNAELKQQVEELKQEIASHKNIYNTPIEGRRKDSLGRNKTT